MSPPAHMDLYSALVVAETAMQEKIRRLQPEGACVADLRATRDDVNELHLAEATLRELRAMLDP